MKANKNTGLPFEIQKHKEISLQLFKLKPSTLHWEKVESTLVKLKGIELNQCDDGIFKLLANNILPFDLNSKFVAESLFTQLMVLQIANTALSDIAHLQIILNGCINLKYLCLENIKISSDQIYKLYQKQHSSENGGGGYYSNDDDSRFSDRVQRRQQSKRKQSPHYRTKYINNVPVIYIPKTVKYLKVCHRFKSFDKTDIYAETFFEEEEEANDDDDDDDDESESKHSSNNSTPLLFAMDDMAQKSPKKAVRRRRSKKQRPLSLPAFYCNLSGCHKQLIEANVILNDLYLLNQLAEHNLSSLKYVVLNYSSSEHNRYLNLNQFCSFYAHLYRSWNCNYSKNVQIVLNNSLYDGWKYSVYKNQISQFFERIFNKREHKILKVQQLYPNVNRFSKEKSLENLFIERLSKCTDFFESRTENHLF